MITEDAIVNKHRISIAVCGPCSDKLTTSLSAIEYQHITSPFEADHGTPVVVVFKNSIILTNGLPENLKKLASGCFNAEGIVKLKNTPAVLNALVHQITQRAKPSRKRNTRNRTTDQQLQELTTEVQGIRDDVEKLKTQESTLTLPLLSENGIAI